MYIDTCIFSMVLYRRFCPVSSGFRYRVDSEAREGWLSMAVDVLGELGVSKRGRDPQTSSSFPQSMAEDLRHVCMSKFWAYRLQGSWQGSTKRDTFSWAVEVS